MDKADRKILQLQQIYSLFHAYYKRNRPKLKLDVGNKDSIRPASAPNLDGERSKLRIDTLHNLPKFS